MFSRKGLIVLFVLLMIPVGIVAVGFVGFGMLLSNPEMFVEMGFAVTEDPMAILVQVSDDSIDIYSDSSCENLTAWWTLTRDVISDFQSEFVFVRNSRDIGYLTERYGDLEEIRTDFSNVVVPLCAPALISENYYRALGVMDFVLAEYSIWISDPQNYIGNFYTGVLDAAEDQLEEISEIVTTYFVGE